MDGRGWPWKLQVKQKRKKTEQQISDKINASPPPPPAAALEFRQDIRLQLEEGSSTTTLVSDVGQVDAIANSKMKAFAEQLAAKDSLIAQHSKVAEDAVSGWEEAQSETAEMKQKLETAEDRASKLEAALKECMKQMREQAELEIQEVEMAMERAAEWERACGDKEKEAEALRSQILEAETEKTAMKKMVQERGRAMKEAVDGRNRARDECEVLRAKLLTDMKKEHKERWAYDQLHHVRSNKKEAEMRIHNELELRRRSHQLQMQAALEAANKQQHLENVRKISKLESECHRLRLLLRKNMNSKLPPAAAIAAHDPPQQQQQLPNMKKKKKMEVVDDLNIIPPELYSTSPSATHQRRRRRGGAAAQLSLDGSNVSNSSHTTTNHNVAPSPLRRPSINITAPSQQNLLLLQESEPMLDQQQYVSADLEEKQRNRNAAKSWATALISELAQFSNIQEKACSCDHRLSSSDVVAIESSASCSGGCDLMDDFAEMEKLASIISDLDLRINASSAENHRSTTTGDGDVVGAASNWNACRLTEVGRMRQQKKEEGARRRLLDTERKLQVAMGKTGDPSTMSPAVMINDALHGIRAALSEMGGGGGETEGDVEVRDTREWSLCGGDHISISSSGRQSEDIIWMDGGGGLVCSSKSPDVGGGGGAETIIITSSNRRRRRRKEEETVGIIVHDLAFSMRKVVHLLESFHSHFTDDAFLQLTHRRNSSQFQSCLRCIIALCHSSLLPHDHDHDHDHAHAQRSKPIVDVDAIDFLAEMASALDWLLNYLFATSDYEEAAAAASNSLHAQASRDYAIAVASAAEEEDVEEGGEASSSMVSSGRGKFGSLVKALAELKSEKEASEAALRQEMVALECRLEASLRKSAEMEYRLRSAAAKDELEAQLRDAKGQIQRLQDTEMRLRLQLQQQHNQFRRRRHRMHDDDNVLLEPSPHSTSICPDLRQQHWINPSPSTMREDDLDEEEEEPLAQSSMALQVCNLDDAAAEKVAECQQQTIGKVDKQQTEWGAEAKGGETAAAEDDYSRRLSPYNRSSSPWNDHRSYSSIEQPPFNEYYEDEDESNSNSPWMMRMKRGMMRRQGRASASYGGEEEGEEEEGNQRRRLITFSPEAPELVLRKAATTISKEGGLARLRFPLKSPGRSPGRFLSLKAWETPEPSSRSPSPAAASTSAGGAGGKQGKGRLSRFFFPKTTKTKTTTP